MQKSSKEDIKEIRNLFVPVHKCRRHHLPISKLISHHLFVTVILKVYFEQVEALPLPAAQLPWHTPRHH